MLPSHQALSEVKAGLIETGENAMEDDDTQDLRWKIDENATTLF